MKVKVQMVWLRDPSQPSGKPDKHPALHQLPRSCSGCSLSLSVAHRGGKRQEGLGFVAQHRDAGSQHRSLTHYVILSLR